MTETQGFSTPMMQQYMEIKNQYRDCFLFYRLGDFYELFLEDALQGAKLLGITLTKRPRGKDGDIPMAGVPYHSAESYISKLVRLGYKIAICEQLSEPDSKGIVERGVVRIITPGTVVDEKTLTAEKNNFVMSLVLSHNTLDMVFADLSTGQIIGVSHLYTGDEYQAFLLQELTKFQPTECILSEESYHTFSLLKVLKLQKGLNIFPFPHWEEYADDAKEVILKHFRVQTLRGFGLSGKAGLQEALAVTLGYLQQTQFQRVSHMRKFVLEKPDKYVTLDKATVSNLEIFHTLLEGKKQGSFLGAIDTTLSPMGARLLRQWVIHPLKQKEAIIARQDAVAFLLHKRDIRVFIRKELSGLFDIERMIARLAVENPLPALLLNVKSSVLSILALQEALRATKPTGLLKKIDDLISPNLTQVAEYIENTIDDHVTGAAGEGKVIQAGVSAELDELRSLAQGGRDWLKSYEERLKQETNITTLKIRSNKVFGYYIEVSQSFKGAVPEFFQRKQTLVNAERYVTDELKAYEEKVFSAEEKIDTLEKKLFAQVIENILQHAPNLQHSAQAIALLDCLCSFAQNAELHAYVRPLITNSEKTEIIQGRHPVVEQLLENKQFVPNDTLLGVTGRNLLLVTGPNMAGKSVYMRQVALIVLMAHIGSFIPAESATISMIDTLFVRSGASDVITEGLSTFMVEMVEVSAILRHATRKSLVVMDEVGRGTSTYDGISIAWAVAEALIHSSCGAKTLFATHYHELQQLQEMYPEKISNIQMLVDEKDDQPLFLHTVGEGAAPHSFGVAVARLAGVPETVCERAESLLENFEAKKLDSKLVTLSDSKNSSNTQVKNSVKRWKKIETLLKKTDINTLTPVEALSKLEKLQKEVA